MTRRDRAGFSSRLILRTKTRGFRDQRERSDHARSIGYRHGDQRHAAHGCPWLIELGAGHDPRYLTPIGMDETFLKNDAHIRSTHRPSRTSSGSCTMGAPAVIENVVAKWIAERIHLK